MGQFAKHRYTAVQSQNAVYPSTKAECSNYLHEKEAVTMATTFWQYKQTQTS